MVKLILSPQQIEGVIRFIIELGQLQDTLVKEKFDQFGMSKATPVT